MKKTMKNEQELNDFVFREVYVSQSHLVEHLLSKEVLNYGDIINSHDEDNEPQEIFEWWLCSDWLLEKLEQQGEPILKTPWGTWWGRTTMGQAIALDAVISKIYEEAKE
jgi:hypothetical protein